MAIPEQFPTEEELARRAASQEAFPGSHDVSMSTVINGMDLKVGRPSDESMYGVFFGDEEIAMIGGSTADAEKVFAKTKEILQGGADLETAKQKVRAYIVELHGGLQQ